MALSMGGAPSRRDETLTPRDLANLCTYMDGGTIRCREDGSVEFNPRRPDVQDHLIVDASIECCGTTYDLVLFIKNSASGRRYSDLGGLGMDLLQETGSDSPVRIEGVRRESHCIRFGGLSFDERYSFSFHGEDRGVGADLSPPPPLFRAAARRELGRLEE